jgi:predicted porin
LYYGLFYKALGKEKDAYEHFQLAYKYESNNVYIMIQYAESLYSTAMKAKSGIDIILSKSMAKKCARIVQRIYDFDSDNSVAENIEVDLYYEFDIQLSKIKMYIISRSGEKLEAVAFVNKGYFGRRAERPEFLKFMILNKTNHRN